MLWGREQSYRLLLLYIVLAITLLIINYLHSNDEPMKLICYYRLDDADDSRNLSLLDIDGSLCTHLTIGFASISEGQIVLDNEEKLKDVRLLKDTFSHLKVLLSLGGGGNVDNFHTAFYNHTSRRRFIDSSMAMMHKYSLDGLDIDWEFPGWSKYYSDVKAFPLLLSEMKRSFESVEPKLLLSIAVSASYNVIKVSYKNIKLIHKSVDWINLMSYDFHSFSRLFPFVEHNSPLFARSNERGFFATLNTKWSAWFWTDYLGVPKQKLVIGLPFYSHNYILRDANSVKPGSLAVAEAPEMGYSQICNLLQTCSNCTFFDEEAKVPYSAVGPLWISHENPRSICLKAKWAKENGYAGCMTFDLNTDDFVYACSPEKRFVLQQTLYDCLN